MESYFLSLITFYSFQAVVSNYEQGKMKFLCLHGYQQSAAIMQSETSFLKHILERSLGRQVNLYYPSGPFPSIPTATNEPTYAWWPEDSTLTDIHTFRYLSDILDEEGPFDGIVGFSQGGSVGSLIAGLLERPKPARPSNFTTFHAPLQLVISYSGYHEDDERLQKYYAQKIKTPILHFISSTDPVMAEERCFRLVKRCEDSDDRVIVYTGSGFHRVPSTKMTAQALSRFLTEVLDTETDSE
ncbi:serine hydrolase FSH [Xylaria sp. FL0064]|nr:serine hydrolase FSH [Xylaria sp. FL0064]